MGSVHLDLRVMAVMLACRSATSILFGLFPAFEATSVDLRSALSEGGRGALVAAGNGNVKLWCLSKSRSAWCSSWELAC